MRLTHALLIRSGLRLDDFDDLWKRAIGSADPMAPGSRLVNVVFGTFTPQHWIYEAPSRRFFNPKPFQLVAPSNELWVSVYLKLHAADVYSIGPEHIAALCEILSATEISLLIRAVMTRLSGELRRVTETFGHVAGHLRLLQTKGQDEPLSYYRLICDSYSETRHPMTGALFNAMRIVGNLTALLYAIECEIPNSDAKSSLASSVAHVYRAAVRGRAAVFVLEQFDCEKLVTHRSFASLWCVLEFLLCSPSPVMLTESLSERKPIERFGTSPVICAHLLIAMAGQQALYAYDSIVARGLALANIQKVVMAGDFGEFIKCARDVEHARQFAEVMATPYLSFVNL
jgi:hypothetical protein